MASSHKPKLYLIDAPMYVFRAWFSLPSSITDAEGWPANAVHGYTTFLCRLLEEEAPAYVAAAFDESLVSSFRNEIYPEYKANRELPPEELERQFQWCQALTRALGVATYASDTYEAEDLLASIARKLRPKGFRMVFVSGDKDAAQLVRAGDVLLDYARERRLPHREIARHFGVRPQHIPDLLALVGDSVDNIPGVPGIGHKTACALIERLGGLDAIYRRLDDIAGLGLRGAARVQRLLAENRDQAYLSRRLAVIHDRVPVRAARRTLHWNGPRHAELDRLFDQLGFGARVRGRCHALGIGNRKSENPK